MIITSNGKNVDDRDEEHTLLLGSHPSDLSSYGPPPFTDNELTSLESVPSELPPSFSLYEAEYFEDSSGNIISHDPHLNTDGEALYRFLVAKAEDAPSYRLHCKGTHDEDRGIWVTHTSPDGRQNETRYESRTKTIVDFDFYIDIHTPPSERPIHWSVPDDEPAYRGSMTREIEHSVGKSRNNSQARKEYDRWIQERTVSGIPPWIALSESTTDVPHEQITPLRSSKSLRQWADDYCSSQKYLKEFTYRKVLYGWNIQQLETAIRARILSTMYMGNLTVEFETPGSKIYIRPDNKLARVLSNKWLKFLLWILLIFPFIWLFKRFNRRGGGHWQVCGGAYCMKKWVPMTGSEDNQDLSPSVAGAGSRIQQNSNGKLKLIGFREGEWLRKWEDTIIHSISSHYQSPIPINDIGTMDHGTLVFPYLDGH